MKPHKVDASKKLKHKTVTAPAPIKSVHCKHKKSDFLISNAPPPLPKNKKSSKNKMSLRQSDISEFYNEEPTQSRTWKENNSKTNNEYRNARPLRNYYNPHKIKSQFNNVPPRPPPPIDLKMNLKETRNKQNATMVQYDSLQPEHIEFMDKIPKWTRKRTNLLLITLIILTIIAFISVLCALLLTRTQTDEKSKRFLFTYRLKFFN
jgi:hypothetical protein